MFDSYASLLITLEKYLEMIRVNRTIHQNLQAFTTKEKRQHIRKRGRAASRANTQLSTNYVSVRKRFILILCFVYMLSYTTSYMLCVVKYKYVMST